MSTTLTLEEIETIEDYILKRLPQVLEKDPRFVTFIEGIVAEKFPRRDEFARLLDEVQQHRKETSEQFQVVEQRFGQVDQKLDRVDQRLDRVDQRLDQVDLRLDKIDQRFDQVDQRFGQVDQRFERVETSIEALRQEMNEKFYAMHVSLDRIGQRWGVRNEIVFRKLMREVIEKSFGAKVEERWIGGEQFDIIIVSEQHILIEISASAGKDALRRLQRKRDLYIKETGITPARFIFAVGEIYHQRIEALRSAGFEVIEPEEPEFGYDWSGNRY